MPPNRKFRPPIRKLVAGANVTLTPASGEGEKVQIDAAAGGTGGNTGSISAGTTKATLGQVVFGNANGMSFGVNGQTVTGSYTVPSDYAVSNHSHGNPTLNLTNLSGTTASNSAGLTLSLSAAAPGAGGSINISAGTTSNNLTNVTFANSNGISFGLNASTITATVATNYLTTAMASNRGSDFVQATAGFNGTNNSGTIASNAISVSGLNQAVSFTSGSVTFQTLSFTNSNGISFNSGTQGIFGSHNALTTAAQSDHSHGNPTLALTNLTGTTASASNGFTLSLSAGAPGAGGGIALANTQTTYTSGTVSLKEGGGAITIASNTGQRYDISVPATSSLSATGGVSISTNGSTISIGVPAFATASSWANLPSAGLSTHAGNNITNASKSKRPILFPVNIPYRLDGVKSVEYIASRTAGVTLNMTHGFGLYSFANSTSLNLAFSTTNALSLTASTQWSGLRQYQITGLDTVTITPGLYVGALYFSGSNNSTAVANIQLLGGQSFIALNGFVYNGTNSTAATASTNHLFPMNGIYSNTTEAFPAAIGQTDIYGQGDATVNGLPYVQIVNM